MVRWYGGAAVRIDRLLCCCWSRCSRCRCVAAGQFRRQSQQTDVAPSSTTAISPSRASGIGTATGRTTTRRPIGTSSAILDYITNMRVRLDGTNVFDLDDPGIFENPIIYVSEPGYWTIIRQRGGEPAEVPAQGRVHHLRRLRGGLPLAEHGGADGAGAARSPLDSAHRRPSDLPFLLRHPEAGRAAPARST